MSAGSRQRAAPGPQALSPNTSLGPVSLTVGDLDGMGAFYEQAIGLRKLERTDSSTQLGVEGADPLVELVGSPDAPPRPARSTGLFHLAILLPSRAQLAAAAQRVTAAGWRFTGASDHLVSEALYLDDPEGNGIEIYRDRPRESWRYDDGQLAMGTLPLDLAGLMAELPLGWQNAGMPPSTRIGHVHLNVADIATSASFYVGALGFEVMVRGYPGALFVSAGGYHHHVGLNTWLGEGAPPPPAESRGLRSFSVRVPDKAELERVAQRLAAAGSEIARDDAGLSVLDPSGNRVLIGAGNL